LAEQTLKRNEV